MVLRTGELGMVSFDEIMSNFGESRTRTPFAAVKAQNHKPVDQCELEDM